MRSKQSELEFKNNLHKNMVLADPIWLVTPFWLIIVLFRSSNKEFLGEYTESHFRLTKRTTFFPIPYVIEGDYKTLNESETEVTFQTKPLMGFNLWIGRSVMTLFILFVSFAIFSLIGLIEGIISFALFISLLLIIPSWIINFRKKQMEDKFKTIFKIID